MTDTTTAIGFEIDASPSISAVSWGAILAGGVVASAITLALMVLGAGLGLTLVSPWYEANAGATTIAVSTIVWLVVTQWASSGLGGYVTGRLRSGWERTVPDEVFFRDTAHGFLAWSVGTLLVAALAVSTLAGVLGTGAQIAGQAVAGAASGTAQAASEEAADPTAYFVDTLFRPTSAQPVGAAPRDDAAVAAEATRILVRGIASESFPADDRAYLATLVAGRTGLSQADAEARVDATIQSLNDAKEEAQRIAEEARKSAVSLSIVAFISLLVGAFVACVAAAIGGRQRDSQDALWVAR